MSLSANLIVYPEDRIEVVTLDGEAPTFEALRIGHDLSLWVGGMRDADAVIVYTRLAAACNEAVTRARARLIEAAR